MGAIIFTITLNCSLIYFNCFYNLIIVFLWAYGIFLVFLSYMLDHSISETSLFYGIFTSFVLGNILSLCYFSFENFIVPCNIIDCPFR